MDHPVIEFTTDADHEHRWRARATNGEILTVSSEGYHREADARHGAMLTLRALLDLDGALEVVDAWLATFGQERIETRMLADAFAPDPLTPPDED